LKEIIPVHTDNLTKYSVADC